VPVNCGDPTVKRSMSIFLDKMDTTDPSWVRHVVIHEMMHVLDANDCFAKSKTFTDAWQKDLAFWNRQLKTMSKKTAKEFEEIFGYFIRNKAEAYAEVAASLIEQPPAQDYRELFFKVFANTWPVVMRYLEQKKIAMQATWPTEASSETTTFQKVN
jgi:hypothetical protein